MATANPAVSAAVQRLAELAKNAGLPLDSLNRFLSAGYVPQPKQLLFHAACRSSDVEGGPTEIGFGGARGPGKTTASFAQVALDDCQRIPGLKVLFLRKVAKAAKESITDLRAKVLRYVPHKYNATTGLIEFKNQSRIIIGHFNHDKDIDAYLGLEYDLIAIEEDTQLSARKKQDIATCLRTSKDNWRPRRYRTTNPGGIDHAGFKRDFITAWRNGKETFTRFIPATVDDNVFVNPEYRQNLERLTGWQRSAWLEGNWDIAAGQFFTNFSYDHHVCKPFEIPKHWTVWASMDYGFTHPTVVYLFTENDGCVYVTSEYAEQRRLPGSHGPAIKSQFEKHGVPIRRLKEFLAGQDVFAAGKDSQGKTIAQQYKELGITLLPANTERVGGWATVLQLLGEPERKIEPKLKIFSTCTRLIERLPAMQHDPNHPEDVLKVNIDDDGNDGDDECDALRYGVSKKRRSFTVSQFPR